MMTKVSKKESVVQTLCHQYRKTHAYFAIENVDEASKDNDEVEDIPSITEIILVMPSRLWNASNEGRRREKTHTLLVGYLATYIQFCHCDID